MPQATSPFVLGLREAAKSHSVAVHVGIHDIADGSNPRKLLNRALYITPDGTVNDAATYDKLHVFDYGSLRESATVQPGTRLTPPFDSPVGRIGSLICFDLRFPEASLTLAQPGPRSPWRAGGGGAAQVITFPSAFTLRTGEAHWETLLRARAVETQSWVVAAAQVGRHNARRASYGRSMVVDPWGRVVLRLKGVRDAEGTAEDGAEGEIGFVEVDLDEVARVRTEMPLQRRTWVLPHPFVIVGVDVRETDLLTIGTCIPSFEWHQSATMSHVSAVCERHPFEHRDHDAAPADTSVSFQYPRLVISIVRQLPMLRPHARHKNLLSLCLSTNKPNNNNNNIRIPYGIVGYVLGNPLPSNQPPGKTG